MATDFPSRQPGTQLQGVRGKPYTVAAMRFYADLHVHSRFSRATARECNLNHLALWAARKGLHVVGTGDFTHPQWREEIHSILVPAEPGLWRLQEGRGPDPATALPPSCRGRTVRFVLTTEIATIYKQEGRTRKVHHLILVPDFDGAERLSARLARIGNLRADGRPILGIASRDLLEIVLECGEECVLIPAHIWTPWFSALGANSGFDDLAECYGDLTPHVFALETGLSSDPPMNWRLSALDRFRLISCSDAHSPARLGREATVFETSLAYPAMIHALRTGEGYGGTVEFFPEEGKYHLDGHRQCGRCLEPAETRRCDGRCPACGLPVTIGVLHRVEDLADRPEGAHPPGASAFWSLIPLSEIVAELLQVGPESRAVERVYQELLAQFGPEIELLQDIPTDDIRRRGQILLAEALDRMRQGRVLRQAGYDGAYGRIRLFREEEISQLTGHGVLFDWPKSGSNADGIGAVARASRASTSSVPPRLPGETGMGSSLPVGNPSLPPLLQHLDVDQQEAVTAPEGPVMIVAGPGTGKTRVLTHRLAFLVRHRGVDPAECLAVTFTRRAAREMAQRLAELLPQDGARISVMTLHALGYEILRGTGSRAGWAVDRLVIEPRDPARSHRRNLRRDRRASSPDSLSSECRPEGSVPVPSTFRLPEDGESWNQRLDRVAREGRLVFDELIQLPLYLLDQSPEVRAAWQRRYRWICVDEFQDLDELQYGFVLRLVPPSGNLTVVGDPDQSIYGFRGACPDLFQQFLRDFPSARTVVLRRNYRSLSSIVEAAQRVIESHTRWEARKLEAVRQSPIRLVLHVARSARGEAEFVARTIEELIGGSGFYAFDSGQVRSDRKITVGFSDFAVLFRTSAQADEVAEALDRRGLPFQRRSHDLFSETPLGRTLLQRLAAESPEAPASEALEQALATLKTDPDYRRELEAVAGTLQETASRAATCGRLCAELAFASDVDHWDPRADRISLLTLHAAKGLEFPVVFLIGCEDGLLPLRWGPAPPEDEAEERRLFFVGMTRARDLLFLTRAERRYWQGRWQRLPGSPFLCDIPRDRLENRPDADLSDPTRAPHSRQLTLF